VNTQQLRQVVIRRAMGRRGLWLSLGLLLIIVALAAQRYATPQAQTVPIQSARPAARAAASGWPGATLMGSAYNGQTDHATRQAPATNSPGWPGATLMGSAYNGQ